MNTIHSTKSDELTLEDIARITKDSRRIRSQALAEMGTTLRSVVRRWVQHAVLYIRAEFIGVNPEKCA